MSKNVTVTWTVDYSAEDWGLFIDKPLVDYAAVELNVAASQALSMDSFEEASAHFLAAADKLAHFGAADTEPRGEFYELAVRAFGPH